METEGKTFRDLQKDARFKRLERNSELTRIQKHNAPPLPASANISISGISSIDGDKPLSDLTHCGSSIGSFGAGSVVLASSNNFRRRLSENLNTGSNIGPAASSVFKQSLENQRINKGRATTPLPAALTRCKTQSLYKSKQKRHAVTSSPKTSFSQSLENQMRNSPMQETSRRDRNALAETNNKAPRHTRVFRNWIVRLNVSGQIIVRGRLESGELVRSKPVKQRLSQTTVVSVFNWRYHLLGDIDDVRKEMPEYVREKFRNGFPMDWESVRQIWQDYRTSGCTSRFRWPKPLTESDDDTQSDISYVTVSDSDTYSRLSASRVSVQTKPSKTVERVERSAEMQEIRSQRKQVPQDPGISRIHSITTQYSEAEARVSALELSSKSIEKKKGATVDGPLVNQNQSTNRSTRFNEIHRQECAGSQNVIPKWKVDAVVDNLTNKNCSKECIDKIVGAMNCINGLFAMPTTNNIDNPAAGGV